MSVRVGLALNAGLHVLVWWAHSQDTSVNDRPGAVPCHLLQYLDESF